MVGHRNTEEWLAWLVGSSQRKWKEATLMLGGLRPSDQVRLHPLIDALSSSCVDQVFWSVVALGRLRGRAKRAIPEVISLVNHEALGVRQAAIHTLSQIGRNDFSAKSGILRGLQDCSPFVRREALQALISMRNLTAEDLGAIEAAGRDSDEAVADWSEIALRNIALKQRRRAKRTELAVAPEPAQPRLHR